MYKKDTRTITIGNGDDYIQWTDIDQVGIQYREGVLTVHLHGQSSPLEIEAVPASDICQLLGLTPPQPPRPIDPPPSANADTVLNINRVGRGTYPPGIPEWTLFDDDQGVRVKVHHYPGTNRHNFPIVHIAGYERIFLKMKDGEEKTFSPPIEITTQNGRLVSMEPLKQISTAQRETVSLDEAMQGDDEQEKRPARINPAALCEIPPSADALNNVTIDLSTDDDEPTDTDFPPIESVTHNSDGTVEITFADDDDPFDELDDVLDTGADLDIDHTPDSEIVTINTDDDDIEPTPEPVKE